MPVQTAIQVRRGTASSWTSTNPTLAAGEIGFETDTGKFKIGTGSTAWASLTYFNPGTVASPLTTKGDLYTYSTADARLAVGNNGETLVADSSATTGLRWQGNYAAGKNKIINGDFGIWQRGTSFSTNQYTADRWLMGGNFSSTSQQTFTPGTAPVSGYEGQYFIRNVISANSGASDYVILEQRIEDVRTFAGQTATVSFWAKAASGTPKIGIELAQSFGTGGSSGVFGTGQSVTLSTSWARYSVTVSVPSISGKTVGTGSFLSLDMWLTAGSSFNSRSGSIGNQANTFDIWGVQVEAGNVATAFQTATGTLAGELAACQRYYQRYESSASYAPFGTGYIFSTTQTIHSLPFQVRLRGNPSVSFSAGNTFAAYTALGTVTAATGTGTDRVGTNSLMFTLSAATGVANGQGCFCIANAGAAAYIEVNSEL